MTRKVDPSSLLGSIHYDRWTRKKIGVPIVTIAEQDKVSVKTVEASILKVEALHARRTQEVANQHIVDILVENKQDVSRAINEALDARSPIFNKVTGDLIETEIDHSTRLHAVSTYKELASVIQPKNRELNVNTNVGVGIQHPHLEGPSSSYESRIREIRKQLKKDSPPLLEAETEEEMAPQ